jgi:GNAT superfamily N-acetyltransferase
MIIAPLARPVEESDIETTGALLGFCFEEELWCMALAEVLDNPLSRRRLLRDICISDVGALARHDGALVVDAWESDDLQPAEDYALDLPAGIILFDTKGLLTKDEHDALWDEALNKAISTLTADEAALVIERNELLLSVENGSWCLEACPDGYHYVTSVGVNPRYRGQGVFSALFDPVIAEADREHKPLCLECYSEQLSRKYAHKGFALRETVEFEAPRLTRYDMVKQPERTDCSLHAE